jgi:hypothetical protein
MRRSGSMAVAAGLGIVLVLGPAGARAQCAMSGVTLETYLRLGPTFAFLGTLESRADGVSPGVLLRAGVLAGLPLQFETSVVIGAGEGTRGLAAGVRLLPVAWSQERGFGLGGGPGHSLGGIAGRSAAGGWYLGAVYEWQVRSEVVLTGEYVITGGGILSSPPSFNVGLKAQMPTLREAQQWSARAGD